jgi:regulator of replication initiation timing
VDPKLDYARKVQTETDEYIRAILAQTQKLRTVAASMQAEQERLISENEKLREQLHRQEHDGRHLQQMLEDISRENQASLDRYQAVVAQNASLANLYVATYRLHGTVEREEVLLGMQEVVANLVGCEEVAIYEIDAAGLLRAIWTFGLPGGEMPAIRVGEGLVGQSVQTGETLIVQDPREQERSCGDANLSACVPLKANDRVIGAVALYRLLPQKFDGLTDLDQELLKLLGTHGGIALYCTQLHARQAPAS